MLSGLCGSAICQGQEGGGSSSPGGVVWHHEAEDREDPVLLGVAEVAQRPLEHCLADVCLGFPSVLLAVPVVTDRLRLPEEGVTALFAQDMREVFGHGQNRAGVPPLSQRCWKSCSVRLLLLLRSPIIDIDAIEAFLVNPDVHGTVEVAARVGDANSIENLPWVEAVRVSVEHIPGDLPPLVGLDAQDRLVDTCWSVAGRDGIRIALAEESRGEGKGVRHTE